MALKWDFVVVPVTVLIGATSGVSAADPLNASPALIIGAVVAGVLTTTGGGLIDSITLAPSTGIITVNTRAVVATANLIVNVTIARPNGQE